MPEGSLQELVRFKKSGLIRERRGWNICEWEQVMQGEEF